MQSSNIILVGSTQCWNISWGCKKEKERRQEDPGTLYYPSAIWLAVHLAGHWLSKAEQEYDGVDVGAGWSRTRTYELRIISKVFFSWELTNVNDSLAVFTCLLITRNGIFCFLQTVLHYLLDPWVLFLPYSIVIWYTFIRATKRGWTTKNSSEGQSPQRPRELGKMLFMRVAASFWNQASCMWCSKHEGLCSKDRSNWCRE